MQAEGVTNHLGEWRRVTNEGFPIRELLLAITTDVAAPEQFNDSDPLN